MLTSFRGVALRQVVEEDMPFLFHLFADPKRCHLWMANRQVYDERGFHEAWLGWTSGMLGAKFLVESNGRPVGLVFEYDRALPDGHSKVTALLDEQRVGRGAGVIATALLCGWLFESLPLRKIYLEVYGYNLGVARMLRKLGLPEEGVFAEDRFWNGAYWDLHLFALYRRDWPKLCERILRQRVAPTRRDPDNARRSSSGAWSIAGLAGRTATVGVQPRDNGKEVKGTEVYV